MVRAYFHDDPEAPVLTGQAASLVNLLQKCLVDGYGNVGQGTWKPPLGWEGVYHTDYTKAAFRSTDPLAARLWLYVNDDGSVPTAGAREATWRGYESLTGLDGTGAPATPGLAFPSAGQLASGVYVRKSDAADGTLRRWVLVGDERAFYLWLEYRSSWPGHFSGHFFGDLVSYRPADGYHCAIVGVATANTYGQAPATSDTFVTLGVFNTAQVGHYLARSNTQLGSSLPFAKLGDNGVGTTFGFAAAYQFPHPVDNALHVAPVRAVEPGVALRGLFPGLYQPLHQRPVDHRVRVDAVEGLPGRELLAVSVGSSPTSTTDTYTGRMLVDVTGPWR